MRDVYAPRTGGTAVRLGRRQVLRGSGALLAAGGAGLLGVASPGRVLAQAAPHRFKVGAAEITVLSDGEMSLPLAMMLPGRDRSEIDALFQGTGATFTAFDAQINVALVKIGAETILVDCGGGPDFMPTLGKLAEAIEKAGIATDTVTKVIFTHAHPDHFWGIVDPLTGDAAFEKAEMAMSAVEMDFWLAPDVTSKVEANFQGIAAGTNRRLKPMADRIKRVKAGDEVAPGVSLIDTAGHTPGHVSVLIRSGSEQLVIGGDALSQSVISFARPDWRWGSDLDADRAITSRRRLLDQLAMERTRLLGYHLPWPGVGNVERKDTAYRFVAG